MLPPVAAVLGLLYCSNLRPCDMILRTHHDLVDNKQLSAVLEATDLSATPAEGSISTTTAGLITG
jgi:hypothetical protein